MRPAISRVLLSTIGIGTLAAGVFTSRLIFFVVTLGAGVLLGTSLSTSRRPLTRALDGFRNHVVHLRLWGVPPSEDSGAGLVLTSVNVLGAGVHVFFKGPGDESIHLKVAQPKEAGIAADSVLIGSARYVQWNGKRLPRRIEVPAVVIALSGPSEMARRESVA